MKIKVAEAEGPVLNWLVAKSEDYDLPLRVCNDEGLFGYSAAWEYGGPIIEREKIDLIYYVDGGHALGGMWLAAYGSNDDIEALGSTPLIAAMRCYVISKLGEEVEVPEELK